MAYVERRERRTADGQILKNYRVRCRSPDGKERSKTFKRRVEADRFCAVVSADLVRRQYVDPDAGKVPFKTYSRNWLDAQTFEETTREAVELRLRPTPSRRWATGPSETYSLRPSRAGSEPSLTSPRPIAR